MATTTSTTANPSQQLTQANFLQLLVTQMTSQDPLNPQSDTDFAAQLAQFTALQTAQTTQSDVATLQASQLIGSKLTVAPSGSSTTITGIATAVAMNAGTPYVVVDGQPYTLSQILDIQPASTTTTSTGSSGNTGSSSSNGSGSGINAGPISPTKS